VETTREVGPAKSTWRASQRAVVGDEQALAAAARAD